MSSFYKHLMVNKLWLGVVKSIYIYIYMYLNRGAPAYSTFWHKVYTSGVKIRPTLKELMNSCLFLILLFIS